jgi:hypothetical protein
MSWTRTRPRLECRERAERVVRTTEVGGVHPPITSYAHGLHMPELVRM